MDVAKQTHKDKHDKHSDVDSCSEEDYYSDKNWCDEPKQMHFPNMNYSQNMCCCPYMHMMMKYKPMMMDDESDDSEDIFRQRPHYNPHIRPHFHPHIRPHIRPHFFPYFPPYFNDYYDDYESDKYDEY